MKGMNRESAFGAAAHGLDNATMQPSELTQWLTGGLPPSPRPSKVHQNTLRIGLSGSIAHEVLPDFLFIGFQRVFFFKKARKIPVFRTKLLKNSSCQNGRLLRGSQ
jgi:hypothetical protein